MRRFLPLLAAGAFLACGDAASGPHYEARLPIELQTTLDLGMDVSSDTVPPTIEDILPLPDGTVWVMDRLGNDPRIRRYDQEGALLGPVSGDGFSAGEYLEPTSLTLLGDGRVLMVDPALPARLTLFDGEGEFEEMFSWEEAQHWHSTGMATSDRHGLIWVLAGGTRLPSGVRLPLFFTRIRPDGEIADTLHLPTLPDVERRLIRVERPGSVRSYQLPYEPGVSWGVGPEGRFVVARRDEYRIVRHGPIGGDRDATEVIARRDVPPVVVSERERRELREELRTRAAGEGRAVVVDVPEIAATKPPLRGFRFTRDGRLLVHVSLPSRREGGEWVEPNGWDVFDPDGSFMGRVILPHDVELHELVGEHLWAVHTDAGGAPSVQRYRVDWRPDM